LMAKIVSLQIFLLDTFSDSSIQNYIIMKTKVYLLSFIFSIFCSQLYGQESLRSFIDQNLNDWTAMYKELHANPELSFQEEKSSKKMAQNLRQLGFEVTEGIGGFGVVGVLRNGDGPTVMVRADMDGLPVVEETGLAYASKAFGLDDEGNEVATMHACGHDLHMTVFSATAQSIVELKDKWSGTLVFIAQPAEERSGGAIAMLNDGLFEKFPKPDYALALHASASLPAGMVGYCPEYALANVDMMNITVKGEGGHGAYPHTTKDPVVLAARLIMDFQTIVSREISPLEPAVLTVGSIHGGTKGNVIPNEVKMELTLRSYSQEVRDDMISKIERITRGVAASAGLREDQYPTITLRNESTPSVYNDPVLTERMAKVFAQSIGENNVTQVPPVMAGEDFGKFGRTPDNIPIMIYWLGAVEPSLYAAFERGEKELPSLHSSKFAPLPEPSIKTGVMTMTSAIIDLLSNR
jgi:amidohydrolase